MGRMISSSESDLYRSNSERIRTELTRETQSTTSHPARKEPLYIATSRDSKSPAVSVSERVRAFSAEPPRTHERSQSMRSSSSASSDQIRRIQTDVRKDIQGPYSALETVPPSPPIAGVLGDVLSFETTRQNKSLRKGPLSGAQRPPAANGLRVQTGPVHRRTLSADQSSDLQVFARSPSSGSEYRTPLDTATSNDSLLSSNPSGSERSSSESVHDASRANDVRPVWKHKWMSEPGVQLTEQERLRVLRNVPESGVSSGDSSIQSLIRLNVNALSVMDLSAGDNGALDHSERVSRSLDTMTGKKPLIKVTSHIWTPANVVAVHGLLYDRAHHRPQPRWTPAVFLPQTVSQYLPSLHTLSQHKAPISQRYTRTLDDSVCGAQWAEPHPVTPILSVEKLKNKLQLLFFVVY